MTRDRMAYRAVGRASLALDWLRAVGTRPAISPDHGFDRTGITVAVPTPLPVLWAENDLLVVQYDSLAHTLWRAQELSLFHRHRHLLVHPAMDFGCGDGSFVSALGLRLEYGVDNDPDALALAAGYGIYGRLLRATGDGTPLEQGAVASAMANSVLEHVVDLDAVLAEIARVLAPGGLFVFTVPVAEFARQLAYYFGARASARVNAEYCHRNLLEPEEWVTRLAVHGLEVESIRHYQPGRFTFWYRMFRVFGNRGLERFVPGVRSLIWKRYGPRFVGMVRRSITDTAAGANVFVMAKRK